MSSINDILSQYASSPAPQDPAPTGISQIVQSTVASVSPDKQAQVANASNQKKQDLGMSPADNYNALYGQMNGVGNASASQQEQDQRNLSPGQYMVKYGVDAYNQFAAGQAEASRSITADVNAAHNTDGVNTITDGIQGVGQGLVNSVVGIGALGAGLVDRDAGQSLSNSLNQFNDNVNANKSDSQQAGQRLVSALNMNTERDNEAQYKQDVKDDGSLIAGLKNIGRGAVDSVSNTLSNPAALLDGTAQGVGSLLTAGPMSKALRAIGSAVIPQATRRGVALAAALDTAAGTRSAATLAMAGAEHAPILGSIGLMEAGGTYQQTNSDISQMPFDELAKQSPQFNELVKGGMSQEDARSEIANRSGLLAAAIQFPVAAATGSLVSKFEANPFAAKGVRTLLQNSGKETLEEGVQSATSQLATNYAEQQEALPNKEISQGVGQQLGQGALFGLTSTGVVSGPGSVAASAVRAPVDAAKAAYALGNRAVDAAKDSELLWNANTAVQAAADQVKSVVKPGIDWLAKRGDEAYRKMQESSPVSDANMETTARDVLNNAPENLQAAKEAVEQTNVSPEEKAATNDYLDSLSGSLDFVADDYAGTPDYVQKTVEGSSNQIEAMQKMAAFVNDEKNSPQERFMTGSILSAIINGSQDLVNQNSSALANLPADHPAYQFAAGIEDLHASFEKSQGLSKAQAAMDNMANNAQTYDIVKPVDADTIATPEGQQNVEAQVALATVAPDKINPEDAKIILQQAKNGAITLNNKQSAALNVAISLVQSAREYAEQSQREGWSKSDKTAYSLKAADDDGSAQPSVLVMARRIYASYAAGDLDGARDSLDHLMQLAVHMNGKVSTINTHLTDVANPNGNNALNYLQLQPDRTWKMTTGKDTVGVTPTSPGSVKFARRVAGEAQFVTNVANGLAQAFSDLGVSSIDHTNLDTRLSEGTTKQTAQDFRDGVRVAGKSDTAPVQTVAAEDTPAQQTQGKQTVSEADNTTQAEQSDAQFAPGDEVIWANKDHDLPVTYRGQDEVGPDGQTYSVVAYQGKPSYVLKSELRAKTESAPVQEATTVPVVEPEQKAAPTTVTEAYDKLNVPDGGKNYFHSAFSLPKTQRSRTQGVENPLAVLNSALASDEDLHSFSGSESSNHLTPEVSSAYQGMMQYAKGIVQNLNKILRDDIAAQIKSGKPYLVPDNAAAYKSLEGKSFNIVETLPNGVVRYNPELIQNAVLAGIQWALTSYNQGANLDVEDIAKILGTEPGEIDGDMYAAFNTSMTTAEALRTLSDKIGKYWGLSENKNDYDGFVKGIPASVASEIMRAFEQAGLVETTTQNFTVTDAEGNVQPRKIDFTALKLDDTEDSKQLTNTLMQYPSAIDDAVLVEPEEKRYTGDERPPIARTQMRNAEVRNTPEQIAVLKNVQNTPYRLHMPMVSLLNFIGRDGVRDLFGEGDLESKALNVNDKKGKEGRNASYTNAFDELTKLQMDLNNRLVDEDGDIGQTDIFYGYNFSRVNRLQMLGRYNPQASKLMREAVLPTHTTVDMADADQRMGFDLGLAQALGIKIHNMPHADSVELLNKLLNGKLAPAIAVMQEFHSTDSLPDSGVETLRNAGVDSPVALQAVSEYARFLNQEGNNTFNTPMYVEADGVTNGIANATQMLSSGGFTTDYYVNSQRTGLFFGSEHTTLNTYRQQDKTDLYGATGTDLTTGLNSLKKNLQGKPDVAVQLNSLQGLMNMFLPGAVLDDQGNLNIDRGVTKNPLTITVYGSSAFGIAGNITDAIVNEIYAKMSEAAQAQANDPSLSFAKAMFGKDGQQQFDDLQQYINDLTTTEARWSPKRNEYFTQAVSTESGDFSSPQAFTFSTEERNAIRANVNSLFIRPMTDSITKTVGSSVMQNMTDIRQATQAISIFQENAFRQAVAEEQELALATDSNYKKHYLLPQNTQNQILKSVTETFPMISTGAQTFFIGGSNNGYSTNSSIGRARDGSYRSTATMYGPQDSGVAGAAYLNIGMGDARMIQVGFTGRDSVKRALPVFDGVNLPIDRLSRDSLKLNGAVFESWNQNPVDAVLKSLNTSLKNADAVDMTPEMVKQMSRALTGDRDMLTTKDEVIRELKYIADRMATTSKSIDARHKTLRQFNLHIDQMASMAASYQNVGEQLPNDPAQAVARMNQVYSQNMKGVVAEAPVKQEGKPATTVGVSSPGSKARVISMNKLNGLVKSLELTGVKKAMFDEIRRSAAAKGYKIITGSREELLAYNEANGNTHPANEFTNLANDGFISPSTKEIYINNATAQTLLHEMVHASTFETVLGHYQGNTTPEITQSVSAIEGMLGQFMNLDAFSLDPKTRTDYENAKAAINGWATNGDVSEAQRQAGALNEFMAWSLATGSLNKVLEKTPILKQITDAVFNAIRKIVYGRKRIPATPGDDILSNLMFHTGVIVRGQASVQNVSGDTKLYQSRVYGNSARLEELNKTFDAVVTAHINEAPDMSVKSKRQTEAAQALINGNDVAYSFMNHGFPMNMQQATTFSMIVSALATQAHIDPASMNYAQELYDHVIDKLDLGHFLPNAPWTQQEEYDATEKYNSIMGRYIQTKDNKGRSSLLPAFLALAMTDDGFRAVLNDIGLPENQKGNGTLDGNIEAFGTNMLDSLGRRMAGDTQSENVRAAVDALTDRIMDTAANRETFIDQYAGPLGSIVDRANEIVSDGLTALSDTLWDGADKVKARTNNKTITALADATKMFAAIASEEKAGIVAEGVSTVINNLPGMQAMRDVIGDIVGRTSTNKDVYDLIKRFRTAIQQDRQQFRDVLPGIIAQKFSTELTDDQWSAMHHALAKTDIVSLFQHFNADEIHALMQDGRTLRGKITAFENRIDANASKMHAGLIKKKAQQLAHFMMGGEPGKNLLRNAEAIGRLLGETDKAYSSTTDMVKDIDGLTSLYAIEQLTRAQKDAVFSLVQKEASGMDFVMSYLKGQRAEEQRKLRDNPRAKFNGYKGYVPEVRDPGVTLIVAEDSESAKLESMSLKRIGDYQGSSAEPGKVKRGYYFGNVQSRTMFNQGLMQNVRQTGNGVDTNYGFTQDALAGRITDRTTVKSITARLKAGETGQNLLPVYDDRGQVVAYERSLDRNIQAKTSPSDHLAKMIGVWRGRQVEEIKGAEYNKVLIDTLHDMYQNETKGTPSKEAEYVNVLADNLDPVLADAVKLMPKEVRDYAQSVFGDGFYVRKDLLNDTFGYREATIGDAWTGNARWSPETLSTAKRVAMGIFGAEAYRNFTKAESMLQNFVQDARTLIIVKSVIVPFANAVANVLQLVGRGVPMKDVVRGVPRKLAEINTYVKTRALEVEAEADLRAAENDPREQRRLQSKIQGFQDSYRRMSIWPLLEAGEFSAIHDASVGDTIELTSGRINSFMEQQVDKLPKSLQTAGRYALVTKDTALFKALEKSVEYGDFVAKAILYDDIVRRQKKPVANGLAAVTEEFVNYDRLPGRFRGYMEKTGLLWFYNYKVRSVKVALSTIRNNPVHALLAANLPLPDMFGNIGSPITDNLITQMADGGLNYSVGMGQAFHAPFLNPWVNLAH
ncbi:virion-associated RNA polymerase [Erwinia phage Kuerle]|nr:virion-associated RNA polymerase [Erwinia phage Kuerle]